MVDWVRIYGNTQTVNALVSVLRSISIPLTSLATPTTATIPSVADINSFIQNIENIRLVSCLPAATGIIPIVGYQGGQNEKGPDYVAVNTWELDLQLLYTLIITATGYMVFCGVGAVGQPRFWQYRFRSPWVQPLANPYRRARSGLAICGLSLMKQNDFRRYGS